jgi:hypothetical protein
MRKSTKGEERTSFGTRISLKANIDMKEVTKVTAPQTVAAAAVLGHNET